MNKFAFSLVVFAAVFVSAMGSLQYGSIGKPIYGSAVPASVSLQRNSEAAAAAITDGAGAKSTAAKLNRVSWRSLDRYGHEIGRPLLTPEVGLLTPLLAASLPPTSFVGQVDPGFERGPYGKIRYHTGSSIGVIALP